MFIIELLKTILIGIVEGITEWLPISSTGHMILLNEWIKLDVSSDFFDMFLVVIQLGAILAVVVLFFHKLNPFAPSKTKEDQKATWILWTKVAVGVLPAAILGLLLNDWMEETLYNYIVVAIMLVLYGVLFIVVEQRHKGKTPTITSLENLTYKTALFIGLFQVLSLVPGTSRSGATILGAIVLGTSRFVAAEFSFFLSIPVMFGASALKLYNFGFSFSTEELVFLAVGMITAFIVSILAIKFLLGYIKQHDFKAFGYYRIGLGILVLLYFFLTEVLAVS
jgi:undecaprenyl-diphosphatase